MNKTLLIIGAGSSKNIHSSFPTGVELANLIDVHLITTKKRKSDKEYHPEGPYISTMINQLLNVFKYDAAYLDHLIDELKIELWAYNQEYYYTNIRTGAPPISIDNLISIKFASNPEVIKLAKQCISYQLKGQESAYLDRVNDTTIVKLPQNWIEYLFYKLKNKGVAYTDIENNLHIISFNYERLFEYLSCKAIKKVFDKDLEELPFIEYIYGNIGQLKDLSFEVKNDNTEKMKNCYGGIKLIGERQNITKKTSLDHYDKILFVGFGYDKDNLNDTLAIKEIKSAALLGMCRYKTSSYEKIEEEFSIKMIPVKDKIEDFINACL